MDKQEQFASLPAFFRGYPQACCWKKQYRQNRLTKVPYQVRTGKCAKVNDPTHFVPMTEAIEKVLSSIPVSITCMRVGLSDDEVLQKANACAQGERFRALWEGRWRELYPSQSEADEALYGTLAFFCGRGIEQMDRLFRRSALMRGKWDALRGEKTYGQRTLEVAIRNCTKVYRADFGRVSAEEEFSDRLEKMRSLNPLKHDRLTDIGFAKLFMDVYADCQ